MRQSAFARLALFSLAGLALVVLARNVFAQDLEGGSSQPPVTSTPAAPGLTSSAPATAKPADAMTSQPADAETPREARRRRRRANDDSAARDEDAAPREEKAPEEPHKARPFATASHKPHAHHPTHIQRKSASTHKKKKSTVAKKHHGHKAKKKKKKTS